MFYLIYLKWFYNFTKVGSSLVTSLRPSWHRFMCYVVLRCRYIVLRCCGIIFSCCDIVFWCCGIVFRCCGIIFRCCNIFSTVLLGIVFGCCRIVWSVVTPVLFAMAPFSAVVASVSAVVASFSLLTSVFEHEISKHYHANWQKVCQICDVRTIYFMIDKSFYFEIMRLIFKLWWKILHYFYYNSTKLSQNVIKSV